MSSFSDITVRFGLKASDINPRVAALIRRKVVLEKEIYAARKDGSFYSQTLPEFVKRFNLTAEDMKSEPIRSLLIGVMDSEFFLKGSGQ